MRRSETMFERSLPDTNEELPDDASLPARQQRVVRDLDEQAAAIEHLREAAEEAFETARANANAESEQTLARARAAHASETRQADEQLASTRARLDATLARERQAVERLSHARLNRSAEALREAQRAEEQGVRDARWLAHSVFDATRRTLDQARADAERQAGAVELRINEVVGEASAYLAYSRQTTDLGAPPIEAPPIEASVETPPIEASPANPAELIDVLEHELLALRHMRSLRVFQGGNLAAIYLGVTAIVAPLAGWMFAWSPARTALAVAVVFPLLGLVLTLLLRRLARKQTATFVQRFSSLAQTAREANRLQAEQAFDRIQRERTASQELRDREIERVVTERAQEVGRRRQHHEIENNLVATEVSEGLAAIELRHAVETQQATDEHAERRQQADMDRAAIEQRTQAALRKAMQSATGEFERATGELREASRLAVSSARSELALIRREVERTCPDWSSRAWTSWTPPAVSASAIRFGTLSYELPSAVRSEEDTLPSDREFLLPALLPFPEGTSLFVRAETDGRARAAQFLQLVVLRLMTSLPPGKVRFTMIDPVGLGETFASFMRLADFDEALVGHRIWTESQHIERRLADLTAHMETVIQKYLRDDFAALEDYNVEAGEIAEPYHVLVIMDYPAGFSEAAVARLKSILASGPRCGVLTLLSAPARQSLPAGLSEQDIRRQTTPFVASGQGIVCQSPLCRDLPLTVESLPRPERVRAILEQVGEGAVGIKRVEVPFEAVAPPLEQMWTASSADGVDIPLGRSGATRLQHLRLGQGTTQHVLIAGRTGSGKSTLLHALITGAAMRYSPDEIELYLIDFKKGVEFKSYVERRLPHARVIAVESEREFGLSVLERLDAEMNRRGELFRQSLAQDISAYRRAGKTLPRILLVIDEFQEFFVQDDKIATAAALLLDRLVRQGRAFGVHVHLGSQTLGGAYSLARSTLGQMAVRIALACSETEAGIILSEENQAARLLNRPGEAIYNDANGRVEGNHPFQAVWLSDDRREFYLDRIRSLAESRNFAGPETIVFEGLMPADLSASAPMAGFLKAAAEGRETVSHESPPQALLGEPIAIGESTGVTFARRGGAHLLWLGRNDEAVAGMQCAALLSLAAQRTPGGEAPRFLILDGRSRRSPLTRLAERLPAVATIHGVGEAAAAVATLAEELERRRNLAEEAAPWYLFVDDLARFADLRRREDDFGFGRPAETAARPDQQLVEILRDGPALGIHALVHCDTLANLQRTFERQAIREFECRVLLQMSASDSSLLIDTPAASQLGPNRALLVCEDEAATIKFRPFAAPEEAWTTTAVERLAT